MEGAFSPGLWSALGRSLAANSVFGNRQVPGNFPGGGETYVTQQSTLIPYQDPCWGLPNWRATASGPLKPAPWQSLPSIPISSAPWGRRHWVPAQGKPQQGDVWGRERGRVCMGRNEWHHLKIHLLTLPMETTYWNPSQCVEHHFALVRSLWVQTIQYPQPGGAPGHWGDPKSELSLPSPQLHAQGHGGPVPVTHELPNEGPGGCWGWPFLFLGGVLGMLLPFKWGRQPRASHHNCELMGRGNYFSGKDLHTCEGPILLLTKCPLGAGLVSWSRI